MKKIAEHIPDFFISAVFSCLCLTSFSQTSKDTIKTGKTNDPMVVNPGHANDSMTVKPAKPNDNNAVLTDTGFISKNIADNMMEIQLSKIARDKGKGSQIKDAASVMIRDHTAILNDLKKLAASKKPGISVPAMPDLPQANMKPANNFDETWGSQMLTMHDAKVAELENFITVTQDPVLKTTVTSALRKIRTHRSLLEKIPGAKASEVPNTVIH